MAVKKQIKSNVVGKSIVIGAGVAAAAAAAYFFLGPNGKKNQKKFKGWMVKMRGEVLERLEGVKEITKPIYAGIVDMAVEKYAKAGNVSREEVEALGRELKAHWRTISKSVSGKSSTPIKKKLKSRVTSAKKQASK